MAPPTGIYFVGSFSSNAWKQHPARDLQDTFYVSDPKKAAKPGPESPEDTKDYDQYFENVRQVHENGKFRTLAPRGCIRKMFGIDERRDSMTAAGRLLQITYFEKVLMSCKALVY